MPRKSLTSLVCLIAGSVLFSSSAIAQSLGSEIVNQEMTKNVLFHPHAKIRSASEVFVPIGSEGTAGPTGIYADKDQFSGAGIAWEDCHQSCAEAGKRLPEPAEFKIACQLSRAGLIQMTDDGEWGSNFAYPHFDGHTNGNPMETPLVGNGGCTVATNGELANSSSQENTGFNYRCVH